MGLEASNDAVGGTILRRAAIQSPNFITGVQGWTVNQDGSAEFDSITVRGGEVVAGKTSILSNGDIVITNGFGAVTIYLRADPAGFFLYQDLGNATQGVLIQADAGANGTDPVNGTSFSAGLTGINPFFGDFLKVVGSIIQLGVGIIFSRQAQISIAKAPANGVNPYIVVDAPEQGNAEHLELLIQGSSPDGTRPGQMLIGQVSGNVVLVPVTTGQLEVQGIAAPTDSIVQILAKAAADNSLGFRVVGDAANRLKVDSNGQFQWGLGAGAGFPVDLQPPATTGLDGLVTGIGRDASVYDIQRLTEFVSAATTFNSVAFSTVPGLQAPLGVGTYHIKGQITLSGNQAAGAALFKFATGTGVSSGFRVTVKELILGSPVTLGNGASLTAFGSSLTSATLSTAQRVIEFDGEITMSTAGTLFVQMACSVAADTFTVPGNGSYLEVFPVV